MNSNKFFLLHAQCFLTTRSGLCHTFTVSTTREENEGQTKFLANSGKHILIFMNYDSMNDIWWNVKNQHKYDQKYAFVHIFV
jgi:hypothetical protein